MIAQKAKRRYSLQLCIARARTFTLCYFGRVPGGKLESRVCEFTKKVEDTGRSARIAMLGVSPRFRLYIFDRWHCHTRDFKAQLADGMIQMREGKSEVQSWGAVVVPNFTVYGQPK